MFEYAAVIVVVGVAAAFLGRRLWRVWRGEAGSDCSSKCSGCKEQGRLATPQAGLKPGGLLAGCVECEDKGPE